MADRKRNALLPFATIWMIFSFGIGPTSNDSCVTNLLIDYTTYEKTFEMTITSDNGTISYPNASQALMYSDDNGWGMMTRDNEEFIASFNLLGKCPDIWKMTNFSATMDSAKRALLTAGWAHIFSWSGLYQRSNLMLNLTLYPKSFYGNSLELSFNCSRGSFLIANLTVELSCSSCTPGTTTSTTPMASTKGYQCLSNVKNIAVYEGQLNGVIIINLSTDPHNVSWKVISISDELSSYTIIDYGGARNPTLTGLYDVNQTGLIIKNATTNGYPMSTAGLYIGQCANNPNRTGAKLLIVRVGPQCSCISINSTASSVSCNVTYAESSIEPMYPIVTWKLNGSLLASYTLQRMKLDAHVYAESTITRNSGAYDKYTCEMTFAPPTDIQYPWLATNAPEFNESCSTPCLYSSDSLNRKPTNTAAVTGSSNVTLECASIYGTDATRWSFTPLGSSSNETIQISNGYQIFPSYQQKYKLNATVNSSVLIVRQLSSETVGHYSCYDGVESASALLLAIPFAISVDPLFGPIAGGTNITIAGSAEISYLSRYAGSTVTGIRNVYIGKDLSSTSEWLLFTVRSTFELVAVTPSATESSIGQPLPIIIEFSPTPFNMSFNKFFVYLPNPEITSIYPNNFIVTGGTLIDVFGQSFSSVAKPIIQLNITISRSADNRSTSTVSTRVCTVPPGNDTYMQCPMPPLSLPDDFLRIINSMYNTSAYRKRRNNQAILHVSRLKRYANVLTLTVPGANGVDIADIYLGFILDGYKKYENINDALPDTKFIFYSAPEINSSDELIQFDPSVDELIHVKGRYMTRGCRLIDYVVHIGNQICNNSDLQDNQLSCRPPKVKPSSTLNDTMYCDQHMGISITVGYKRYQYACLTYTDHSRRLALIIGLTVGLGVFAILLIILIVCIVRCRRKKVSEETDIYQNPREVELRNRHDKDAKQPETQHDLNIIHTRQNTKTMYKPDDVYANALQFEPQDDYENCRRFSRI